MVRGYNKSSLYELIEMAQLGDKNSLLKIINKFKPLINKLARKLKYEEAETDLVILFIQMLQSMNLTKFNQYSEGVLVAYLYNSLNNKCIDLFRKYVLRKTEELELNLDLLQTEIDIDTKIIVNELLNLDVLTYSQREILKKSFLFEYSDSEIAKMFHVSRQAINKTKNRGIQAIRTYLSLN